MASPSSTQVFDSNLLAAGGAVLMPSRLGPHDLTALLRACSGRNVALMVEPDTAYAPDVQQALAGSGVTRWLRSGARDGMIAALDAGTLVICVPPSAATRRAANVHVPREVIEDICQDMLSVQPVGVDHPREHCLTIERPHTYPECVLCFAPVLSGEQATPAAVQQALIEAAASAYAKRASFDGHLGRLLVAGLKKHRDNVIHDGLDDSTIKSARIFAAAAALAGVIRKETKQPRIGIVMPPGRGGVIANLAVVFAGKVPVNLNFTAGKEAIESSIRQSGIDRILTADVIVRKMQTFPWPAMKDLIFLERVIPKIKSAAIRWALLLKLLPAGALSALLGLPTRGGDDEAVLLFTSGSSGEPKGVPLTHRNLISNVTQFAARLDIPAGARLLGCLPLFHSFGSTVTLWFPVIAGCGLVTYPTPLESPKLAELIEKHGVEVLLATPTFLRGYLRRVKVEQLASLKLVVTGAEKLPLNLAEEFRRKFGKPVMEGYGLTETSPVATVNLPDPDGGRWPVLPARRPGSTGQFMPGMAVRITEPSTGEPLPLDHSGMVWLRGPNIFPGYLNQPRKTGEVLQDGWFRSGDIGRVDGDGFLFIEGRLSRFSKIGGEMVPHETVEDHIIRALGMEGDSERRVAVVGVPDPDKGEALVLLSTVAGEAVKQELIQLRYTLLDRGVPALWIPKKLVPVPHIPILASGKLDIKGCERLAAAAGD